MGRELTISYARSLVGAKWRHQGRTKWAVDCVGLVVLSLRSGGLTISDDLCYGREPWKDGLQLRLQARFGLPIPESEWGLGDIAVFKAPQKGPCHIGLLARDDGGNFTLIHAHAQHDTTEHILDETWRRMLVEVYSPWAI